MLSQTLSLASTLRLLIPETRLRGYRGPWGGVGEEEKRAELERMKKSEKIPGRRPQAQESANTFCARILDDAHTYKGPCLVCAHVHVCTVTCAVWTTAVGSLQLPLHHAVTVEVFLQPNSCSEALTDCCGLFPAGPPRETPTLTPAFTMHPQCGTGTL